VGDPFRDRPLDASDEPQREVEIVGARPSKLRREPGACFKKPTQLFALALGQREREKSPDL
jgi:hypothetical protein